MTRFTGLLGILVILAVAWLFSTNRRAIQPRVLFWGLALQFGFAFLVLKTDFGKLFQVASVAVNACNVVLMKFASAKAGASIYRTEDTMRLLGRSLLE